MQPSPPDERLTSKSLDDTPRSERSSLFSNERATLLSSKLSDLERATRETLSIADYKHLRWVKYSGHFFSLLGYATGWMRFNPISALLMSTGIFVHWITFHHVNHRGYDQVPGLPARFLSKNYGKGWRRFVDWFDWILPEAWEHEHIALHHRRLNERQDPDLVERNLSNVRRSVLPLPIRYLIASLYILTWRFSYYAPRTLMLLQNTRDPGFKSSKDPVRGEFRAFWKLWNPFSRRGAEFWMKCILPYGLFRFVLLPSIFLSISREAALNVLLTSLLAEILANIHSFIVIGPNHTGEDLYRFDDPAQSRQEYDLRQILGTTNFRTGRVLSDLLQGWLNYHIEHHLWQDLPMSKYTAIQPQTFQVCREMGVPYVQESIWKRFNKTLNIMVGRKSMRRVASLTSGRPSEP